MNKRERREALVNALAAQIAEWEAELLAAVAAAEEEEEKEQAS